MTTWPGSAPECAASPRWVRTSIARAPTAGRDRRGTSLTRWPTACSNRVSCRAGRRFASRQYVAHDRSHPAHPVCRAATSGSRACTSRRYRPRAGCRRRLPIHRWDGNRGCRSSESLHRAIVKRCAIGRQHVTRDLVQVEAGGEDVVLILGAEVGRFVAAPARKAPRGPGATGLASVAGWSNVLVDRRRGLCRTRRRKWRESARRAVRRRDVGRTCSSRAARRWG